MTGIVIEQGADCGFAVKRNGTVMLRTATDTEWQAMGNGLVLVFGYPAMAFNWGYPDTIVATWRYEAERSVEALEIVACRVIEEVQS